MTIYQQLKKELGEVRRDVLLAPYTTFKIGGQARYFVITKSAKELIKALKIARENNLPYFILGGGSNILISDQGFKGIVIKISNFKFQISNCKIISEAGVSLSKLVSEAVANNLSGLEWFSGIPGTIGGAVRGNTGWPKGKKEIGSLVERVKILSNGKLKNLKNKACKFGYRDSVFKHKNYIILEVELKLKKDKKENILKREKKVLKKRQEKNPAGFSAGCIFKNIEIKKLINQKTKELKNLKTNLIPAGFLIEKCGLKGKRIGEAKISKKHANFIINLGDAKAKDVKALINLTKRKVKEKFGFELEEEIEYLGFY